MIKEALVVNAKSSFFYCLIDEEVVECRASKKLKLNKQKIISGDYVLVDIDQDYITELLPRKNYLHRPEVSNVDAAMVIFSATEPKISYMLLDKMLLQMEINGLDTVIVITKMDLLDKQDQELIKDKLSYYQKIGYQVYYKHEDFDQIKTKIREKKYLLTGQSGVGKSTLINELIPELNIKTQAISQVLNRGKHTTRELTFYPFNEGYLIDSPGFSSLNLNMSCEVIRDHWREYQVLASECKFNTCFHLSEPGCAIKAQLGQDPMYDQRYYNYQELIKEAKESYANY